MFNRNNRYEPCPNCVSMGRDHSGDNLVLFPDGGTHCFACGYHTGAKRKVQEKLKDDHGTKSLRPADFTREIPAAALNWLLQFGLPWSYWKETIGYSPSENRLIFEVKDKHELYFSLGRFLPVEGANLRQEVSESRMVSQEHRGFPMERTSGSGRSPRKWYVWGDPHRHCHLLQSTGEKDGSSSVVLVEDLISAAKVSLVANAIPLFGTKLHEPHWYYLFNSVPSMVYLWLDKDQEHRIKQDALRIQQLLGIPVIPITTDKDPKYLSKEQIIENL